MIYTIGSMMNPLSDILELSSVSFSDYSLSSMHGQEFRKMINFPAGFKFNISIPIPIPILEDSSLKTVTDMLFVETFSFVILFYF